MLLVLGLQALAVFLIALAGWAGGMLTPIVGVHAVLALAAMPLIAGAMGHFVPVLTRSGDAPRGVRWAPGVLLLAGALAIGFVAGWGGLGFLHGAVGLVCGVVVALLLWIMRRARRALGTPHPGWLWYLAALACLLGGVLLIAAAYRWPTFFSGLRTAHVRLNLFGFVGLTALGTLHVLLPTVFGAPDPQTIARLRRDLPLLGAAVLALVGGGLLSGSAMLALTLLGVALYASCVLRLGFAWVRKYGRGLWEDGAASVLLAALAGLLVALLVLAAEALGYAASSPAVFVVAFLLPLVSGALSQLVPVWAHPGRLTPARGACRRWLVRHGRARALMHVAAGLALAAGAILPALFLSAAALGVLLCGAWQAHRAGVLGGTCLRA